MYKHEPLLLPLEEKKRREHELLSKLYTKTLRTFPIIIQTLAIYSTFQFVIYEKREVFSNVFHTSICHLRYSIRKRENVCNFSHISISQ